MRRRTLFALATSPFVPAFAFGDDAGPGAHERDAHALFARLRAPCCYQQTLDVHESEGATVMRAAIRARLASGETAAEIEADLVGTYGARIRAVQRYDLANASGGIVGVIMASVLVGLVLLARRWRDRYDGDASVTPDPEADARLDATLAERED